MKAIAIYSLPCAVLASALACLFLYQAGLFLALPLAPLLALVLAVLRATVPSKPYIAGHARCDLRLSFARRRPNTSHSPPSSDDALDGLNEPAQGEDCTE